MYRTELLCQRIQDVTSCCSRIVWLIRIPSMLELGSISGVAVLVLR